MKFIIAVLMMSTVCFSQRFVDSREQDTRRVNAILPVTSPGCVLGDSLKFEVTIDENGKVVKAEKHNKVSLPKKVWEVAENSVKGLLYNPFRQGSKKIAVKTYVSVPCAPPK
jgi:hypothetical protein